MDFSFLFAQFLNGITIAMIIFLIASGLTLILGVMELLNLAHGSFYMIGAFLIFSFSKNLGGAFWINILIVPVIVAVIAAFIERFFLHRIYNREKFYVLLFTFAWILVFDDLVIIFWGRDFHSMALPPYFSGSVPIFGYDFPKYYIFILILGPVIGGLIWYIINRTRFGILIRACSTDSMMLKALGKNVANVYTFLFAFGAWLAGLGGVIAAPIRDIVSGMGLEIVIESFIVVVLGGMGSLVGAFIGALIIGQINAFGILFLPKFTYILVYILLALVLIFKPKGLFGED